MGIVVFGAVFVDIKGYPLAQYIPGGRNVGRVVQTHGGVSRNVAEDIANVELHPTFVSVVDNTGVGDDVVNKLRKEGVDTRYISRTPDGLGTWLAVFDNNGDVVASISKRPDLSMVAEIMKQFGDQIISNCDSIVVEIDMDEELLDPIFSLAEKYDKRIYAVVSNMSIAMERRDYLSRVSCFVCNEQEAGLLFSQEYEGLPIEEFEQVLLKRVQQAKIDKMVVTLGERGAIYVEKDGKHGYTPPQKVDIIDTTGCGDAFFAGVAIGLTYGKDLAEACSIGTRIASVVIATNESVCPHFQPAEFNL